MLACTLSAGLAFGSRNSAVISAMIETAISDGDTAPMFEPDRRLDARDVGLAAPCAFSRSPRLAWVFREPSAPI